MAVFTASTYSNWTFEGIDLVAATYQMIFGSLGGGIVAVLAAFAYAATLRPVLKRR